VTLLEKPNPSPLYSCILNAQGRYLHDLFLHRLNEENQNSPTTLLLDIDSQGKNDLLRLLKRYRLREKIELDDVSEDWHVWTRFGAENTITNELRWPVDPRLPLLGYRTLLPSTSSTSSTTTPSSSSEPIVDNTSNSTTNLPSNIVPWEAYRRYRISLGVPEGDVEIPSGEAIALEYNIDQGGLNGISFTKGCYVGQELMARTHFKGVVRKRIMPVTVTRDGGGGGGGAVSLNVSPASASQNIVDSASGKVVGSLRVVDTEINQGLALLRLKEAQEVIDGTRILKLENSEIEVVPRRPEWWPNIWGREQ
jgi:transferase CAF17, mitochondrial